MGTLMFVAAVLAVGVLVGVWWIWRVRRRRRREDPQARAWATRPAYLNGRERPGAHDAGVSVDEEAWAAIVEELTRPDP